MTKPFFAMLIAVGMSEAGEWSKPAEIRHEEKTCLAYRAKIDGEWLVVQADLQPGWHTFAMDNKERADEKLAGKMSLGLDRPTSISVKGGAEVAGSWSQSEPKDFSKPEIRWYAFGYEGRAVFAAKVKRAGSGPAVVGIKGQACTETTCKNVDVELEVAVGGGVGAPEVKALIPVRAK